ncbi:MAG: hypothetical protein F2881_10900 [Actinobacteria bacterium]|uniref:Unannotated protein n=1 Tax=freshwater metagenome TaxID=449393 RepID=A0A6J7RFH0_9ZZZZ|nr:hypothetical protein [Actinomycetota bacterium]
MKRTILSAALGAFVLAAATITAGAPASAMAPNYPSPGAPYGDCGQNGGRSYVHSACVGMVNRTHGFISPGVQSQAGGVAMHVSNWVSQVHAGTGGMSQVWTLGTSNNDLPINGGWSAGLCKRLYGTGTGSNRGCTFTGYAAVNDGSATGHYAEKFRHAVYVGNGGVSATCSGGASANSSSTSNSTYVGCEEFNSYGTGTRWTRHDYRLFTKTLAINVTNRINQRLHLTSAVWNKAIRDVRGDTHSSATISGISVSGNVVHVATTEAHGIEAGSRVTIEGVSASLDGHYEVTTVPTPSRFTYSKFHGYVAPYHLVAHVDIRLANGALNNVVSIAPYAEGYLPVVHFGAILPIGAANTVTLTYKFMGGPEGCSTSCNYTDQVVTIRAIVAANGAVSGDSTTCTVSGGANRAFCNITDYGVSGHDAHYGVTLDSSAA